MRTLTGLLAWLPLLLACVAGTGDDSASDPRPDPDRGASDVVRIQLDALARGSGAESGAGIAVAFRFASPQNKRATGPLERFTEIVRGEAYAPLLGHLESEILEVVTLEGQAVVTARIVPREGPELVYVFMLTRQAGGRFARCWMTDAVYRTDAADEGERIAL